jgi:hypothetical protein
MRTGVSDPRIEVFDRKRSGLREDGAMDLESGVFEHSFDQGKCTPLRWSH